MPAEQINKIPLLFLDFSLTKLGFSLTNTTKLKWPSPPLQPSNPPVSCCFFSILSTKEYYILLNKKWFLHLNKVRKILIRGTKNNNHQLLAYINDIVSGYITGLKTIPYTSYIYSSPYICTPRVFKI